MKYRIIFSILATLVLASCQNNSLRIVNHEKPDFQTDFTPFENAGCKSDWFGRYDCDSQSQLFKLGCDAITKQDLLGGFTPNYPIVGCHFSIYKDGSITLPASECITSMVRQYGADCNRLVIYSNGEYLVIKNLDELRNLFAPIDSPDEALSFALASTYNYAEYGQTRKTGYVYYVHKLEDTYVETIADGYLVHLFYNPVLGCGPFITEAVEVKVSRDGQIEEINHEPVYRDPSQDGYCRD